MRVKDTEYKKKMKTFFDKYYLYLFFTTLLFLMFCATNSYSQVLPENIRKKITEYENLAIKNQNIQEYKKSAAYYNKIAIIYWKLKMLEQATDNFIKAANNLEAIEDFQSLKKLYSNIGSIFIDLGNIDQAKKYFKRSLEIKRKSNDLEEIASGLVDYGYILKQNKEYDNAVNTLEEALKISYESGNSQLILNSYNLLAQCHSHLGNIGLAKQYEQKYTSYQQHIENESLKEDLTQDFKKKEEKTREEIQETRVALEAAEAEKRAKEAELELKRLRARIIEDSLQSLKMAEDSLLEMDRLKRLEIKNLELEKAHTQKVIREQKIRQSYQELIIYFIVTALILIISLSIFIYRNYKTKKKANVTLEGQNKQISQQNEALEKRKKELERAFKKIDWQNKNIKDSINYAVRIQNSMMPVKDDFSEFFPESFIYFKPKDLVSGDYYWFNQTNGKEPHIDGKEGLEEKKNGTNGSGTNGSGPTKDKGDVKQIHYSTKLQHVVAAIDCTGHGVPGALLSMVGMNLLEEIVDKRQITKPNRILEELHKGIRKALKQDTTSNRDGMDIALCVVNKQENMVEFAGAKNPLVYVKNGKLHVLKGDIYSVGGLQIEQERKFTLHQVKVDSPVSCYIFSDGYADQFGGKTGKKFMIKNFRKLLYDMHQVDMTEQPNILDHHLMKWKGTRFDQTDDILVLGFKVYPNI